jgi:hypothetical protein
MYCVNFAENALIVLQLWRHFNFADGRLEHDSHGDWIRACQAWVHDKSQYVGLYYKESPRTDDFYHR